ncbi:MAG: MarR family transcriptional regulator [Acidimicrobiia bacterium]
MTQRTTTVLFDIWILSHITTGLLDEALAGSGLSGDDFGLYSLLLGWAPATPGEIAQWSGMRPNTVSVALKRIESKGHLDRRPNPADGRSSIVSLNEQGRAAHANAARGFFVAMEEIDAGLDDIPSVRLVLQRLDGVLRQIADIGPRPYSVPDTDQRWHLVFDGPPLTDVEERDVRRYVDWVRSADG